MTGAWIAASLFAALAVYMALRASEERKKASESHLAWWVLKNENHDLRVKNFDLTNSLATQRLSFEVLVAELSDNLKDAEADLNRAGVRATTPLEV